MISTLHPMHNDIKPPHDYYSYKLNPARVSPPESPRNLPSFFNAPEGGMNNTHRGLPPPAAMQLPPTDRSSSVVPSLAHLPAPPAQWTGQDESMRNWLHAKAEEDRRKQEEEKTKQETLRLDQRKIEQTMLRESLQGGIPPPMVPLIFAGMGGGNLPSHTLEWAQQYLAQLSLQNQQQQQQIQVQQQQLQQHQQQQQQVPQHPLQQPQQSSPDMRRENRMIPANPYAAQQPLQPAPTSMPAQSPVQNRGLIQPPPPATSLSRLNTAELQPLPSASQPPRQPVHPLQQAQSAQPEQSSGPSLFFHHWTPPSSSNQPPTPSGKSTQGSPFSQSASSHLRSEYQNSPKKRKTAGGIPVSQPAGGPQQDPSPPYSSRSSRERDTSPRSRSKDRAHSRHHSDDSSRDADSRPIARPSSRQQRQDELSGANHHHQQQQQQSSRPWTGSSTSGSTEDNSMR